MERIAVPASIHTHTGLMVRVYVFSALLPEERLWLS